MEIITDILFALIALVGVFYGFAVRRFMRHRVKAARRLGNGRLALAKGSAASAGRKLWALVIAAGLGVLVGIRDTLQALNDPEPFELIGLIIRLLFIAFVLLIVDSFRVDKTTYIDGIFQLSRDSERDKARDIDRDAPRDSARDVNRDIGRDPARDTDRDEGRDTYRDTYRDKGRDEAADTRDRAADDRESEADRRETKADERDADKREREE